MAEDPQYKAYLPQHAAALASVTRLQARSHYLAGMAKSRGRLHTSHARLNERAIAFDEAAKIVMEEITRENQRQCMEDSVRNC